MALRCGRGYYFAGGMSYGLSSRKSIYQIGELSVLAETEAGSELGSAGPDSAAGVIAVVLVAGWSAVRCALPWGVSLPHAAAPSTR